MARQDKPAAAIANALGSNVQNVFLAMAMPWLIFMLTQGTKAIPQNVKGINEGVYWMMGTLILVLIFSVCSTQAAEAGDMLKITDGEHKGKYGELVGKLGNNFKLKVEGESKPVEVPSKSTARVKGFVFKLSKSQGIFLAIVYLVYVLITSGESF